MAAGAGVDLHDRRARGADALAVVRRRLIAFDHEQLHLGLQIADRALEQRRLAGARRADEIEGKDLAAGEPGAVARRERIVLGQHARLECDNAANRVQFGWAVRMVAAMLVVMAV